MSVAQFRLHLREALLAVTTVVCIIVGLAAVSIALDVHAMRMAIITGNIELREGLFTRLDRADWKADTFLSIESGMEKNLEHGITQVRVQVQQASEDQATAIKAASAAQKTAEETVEQTISRTADAIEHAADLPKTPASAVTEKPAKSASVAPAPTIFVNPLIDTTKLPTVPIEPHRNIPRFHFLRRLWPFHHHARKQ